MKHIDMIAFGIVLAALIANAVWSHFRGASLLSVDLLGAMSVFLVASVTRWRMIMMAGIPAHTEDPPTSPDGIQDRP